jgi:hypothetical protein
MTKRLSSIKRHELEHEAWVWQSEASDDYWLARGLLRTGHVIEAIKRQNVAARSSYAARHALFKLLGADPE